MKRWMMLLAGGTLALYACDGGGKGDDDDDVQPGEFELTVNAVPHAGEIALFRFRQGNESHCAETTLNGSGAGVLGTNGLMVGNNYNRIELVLNLDGNATFDDGVDHVFAYPTINVTTGISLVFNHDTFVADGWDGDPADPTNAPGGFSWQNGTGCPGL